VTDVVVIGGGITGCAAAFFLAVEGADVVLLEQGDLNTFASGSNSGSLHAQIAHEPFTELGEGWAAGYAPTLRLFAASIELWHQASALVGADLEVRTAGGLLVASSPAQLEMIRRKAVHERAAGLEMRILGRDELREVAPYLADGMLGAGLCPIEGKANPLVAATAFARAAGQRGTRIVRRTRVLGITRDAAGYAVETTGGTYRARRVINAAGAEAGRIAAHLGVTLGVDAVPIQTNVTEPVEPLVPHLVYYAGGRLTLKQTPIGTLLIGGGWPARLDAAGRPVADPGSLAANLAVALEVVPRLGSVHLVRTWAAIVNGTADWRPLIGELPGQPGFYVCFVPWMGFTAGPLAGRIVANLALGREPPVDVDVRAFAL
jgi:glycine/D-amino acid oxidase-like deaminating enzyme